VDGPEPPRAETAAPTIGSSTSTPASTGCAQTERLGGNLLHLRPGAVADRGGDVPQGIPLVRNGVQHTEPSEACSGAIRRSRAASSRWTDQRSRRTPAARRAAPLP